jgi:hypothetical protein
VPRVSLDHVYNAHTLKIIEGILQEPDESFPVPADYGTAAEQLHQLGTIELSTSNDASFSCEIIKEYYAYQFFSVGEVNIKRSQLASFADFIFHCVQRISNSLLEETLSTEAPEQFYERQFQTEFYKAACPLVKVLGATCHPDMGRVFDANGYIDFMVNGGRRWGVELLTNPSSTALDEHLERFAGDGKYSPLMLLEWCVLFFVKKETGRRKGRGRGGGKGKENQEETAVKVGECRIEISPNRAFKMLFKAPNGHVIVKNGRFTP